MKHDEGRFSGADGVEIYWQCWLPDDHARMVLLVAHGYGEHSGRYANLIDALVPRGIAVYAPDHRGHGKSAGERVAVESFFDYVTDLHAVFDIARARHPSLPVVLLGHSMGSMIAISYAALYQHELAALVISGGGISNDKTPPPQTGLDLSQTLSRDPAVGQAYRDDPLVFHGTPHVSRVSAIREMREKLPLMAREIALPIIIMAGEASPLGDAARSEALFEAVASKDKTLKLYPDLLHEIFNEPEHPQVIADLASWLDATVR